MGFNVWLKNNKNLFQFDGWRTVKSKKSNKTFVSNGWINRSIEKKCSKASINSWKNSIV